MSEYSPIKVFHHQDKLQELKRGNQIVPAQVQIFPSDLCNQDCSFCAYRMSNYFTSELFTEKNEIGEVINRNPSRMISYEKLIEIIDDLVSMGIKAIQWTGGGEPTVHPRIKEVFKYADRFGFDQGLVTNGVLLSRFYEEVLKFKWIRVSIDAGNPGTYSKTRHVSPDTYIRVWDQIRELVERKREFNEDRLIIGIGFVISKDNWFEVLSCTEKAKTVGVDNVRISGLFQPEDEKYFESFYEEAAELCRQAKKLERNGFLVFNMFGDRVEDLKQHSPDYSFCGYQQFNTLIGGDLNVYRCCVTAYNSRGLIGSIKDRSFKSLWESTEKRESFDNFNAKRCPRCMFNNKNKIILYALDSQPKHINFV